MLDSVTDLASLLKDPSLLVTKSYVAGQWIDADDGSRFPVTNPARGDVICDLPNLGRAETDRAIKAAHVAHREWAARTAKERSDVLRAAKQPDAAWTAFAEIKRWEPDPDKQTRALEAALCEQAGLLGLALDALNARLKDEPLDRKLRTQRAALYDKLGWADFAANERLRLAVQAQQKKTADAL